MKYWNSFLHLGLLLLSSATQINAQWIRQYPMEKLEQVLDLSVKSDGFGFASGGDDMILRLDPTEKIWTLLTTTDLNWTLEAIDYLDGTSGNVAAAGGQGIVVSFNAGQTWAQIPDAPGGVVDIKMLSMTEMIVAGDEGVFKYENNTWTDLNLPVTSGVEGAHILDDQHMWIYTGGTDPTIYYTSNGGAMWNVNNQIERPDAIRFFDAQQGVCIENRIVYTTANGGQTWTEISNSAIHNSVYDVEYGATSSVMMAATLNGDPAYSIDGGLTWDQQDLRLIINRNFSVAFGPGGEFWMGNDLSSIALSVDAGNTWTERSGPERKIIYDVHFINRNVGYAVGTGGTLLRTENGGAQWEDLTFDPARTYWSVGGLNENDVWVGTNQKILHSSDGGDTWEERGTFLGSNFVDFLPINAIEVLVCATNGVILRSDNAGVSWDTVFQTNNQIRSLSHISGQRYMATGFNGLILRSEDAGLTWSPLAVPEPGLQYEQSYFLGNDGWLVTSSFKKLMWHTSNAGDSWEEINLPVDRFWDGVFFISPDTGIIVGRSTGEGRTYITFNGGQNWQSGYITPFSMHGVTGIPSPNGIAWIHGYGSNIEVLPYCDLLPVIANFQGDNSPCENDIVTYSISAQNVDNFFWLFPTGWQFIGSPNNDTVTVRVGRNSGLISIVGSNGCGFSSPINLQAGPILLPLVSNLTGDVAPCEAELKTYTVTGSDINDFTWAFPGDDWEVVGNQNTEEIQVFVGESAGTISVIGSNSCGASETDLSVMPSLRPRTLGLSGETTPCEGELVTYIANVQFAASVNWTYPADWVVNGPSDEASILLIAGVADGLVTAAGVNACGVGGIQELQTAPIDVPVVTVIVNDNNLSLSENANSYQWYLNGQLIGGATGATYTATTSGDYYAIMTLTDGCETISNTVTVMVSSTHDGGRLASVRLYPSPAVDVLMIEGVEGHGQYEISDTGGKVILQGALINGPVSVEKLTSGTYLIRMRMEQDVLVQKFSILK